jgi:hypothetical protein
MNDFKVVGAAIFAAMLALTGNYAAAAQAPGGRVVLLDRIVAVVNEDVITRRDLDDRMKVVTIQLKEQGTPAPPVDVLERQVLDRMIYTKVQLQFAKETGSSTARSGGLPKTTKFRPRNCAQRSRRTVSASRNSAKTSATKS